MVLVTGRFRPLAGPFVRLQLSEALPLHVGDHVLLRDPGRARVMGEAGRKRAVAEFGWPAIAAQTADLYAELVNGI